MENFKLLIIIFIALSHNIFAQRFMHEEGGPFPEGRIAELEKIKLIETLDLDEETMLKFFSRRNAHHKKIKILVREKDSLVNKLGVRIRNESKNNYESNIQKILEIEEKLVLERKNFLESIDDILSSYDVAKLIVFERRFRNEIRKELLKQGKRMRGKNSELE